MAARQDQGLQIALIILIFLFILSAVAAYIGWKSYGESAQRGDELQNQLGEARTQTTNLQTENEELRTMTGFGANDNMADVKTAYEADMKKMGAGIADETRRFYRNVLQSVYEEGLATAASLAASKNDNKKLDEELTSLSAQSEKQISQYRDQAKKSDEDAAARKVAFDKYQAEYDTQLKELMNNLKTQREGLEKQIAQRDATVKENADLIALLRRGVENLKEQVPTDTESFEIPDGRISWVNQNGTVWINVGEADALRRQITFNVYDADEHDAGRATKKGSIEVTRILGDHMAEAKVTEDNPSNPILTGDNIYSPVWHRGKKLRFALAGVIDFDGDGESDAYIVQNSYSARREIGWLNGGISVLLRGDRNGRLSAVPFAESGLSVPGDGKSAVATDLNGDNWPDIVVGVNNAEVLAFENQGVEGRRMASVRLTGQPGNPTAVGARVTVHRSDGWSQTSEVAAGGGYLSQQGSTLWFGLGEKATIASIDVRWPDGQKTRHVPTSNELEIELAESEASP